MVKRISQFDLFKRLIKIAFPQNCYKLDFKHSPDGFTFYAFISYKKLNFVSSTQIMQALKYKMDYSCAQGISIDFYVHNSDGKTILVIYQSFDNDDRDISDRRPEVFECKSE